MLPWLVLLFFKGGWCFYFPLTFKCCSGFLQYREWTRLGVCQRGTSSVVDVDINSFCRRQKLCLHLRLLNTDGLTTEVQQQWLIKQESNLAVSSRFNDAHHRIDLWLINYCRFHYPAERMRPISLDTTTWAQSEILDLPWLIRCYYMYRLNWQGFNDTKRGG